MKSTMRLCVSSLVCLTFAACNSDGDQRRSGGAAPQTSSQDQTPAAETVNTDASDGWASNDEVMADYVLRAGLEGGELGSPKAAFGLTENQPAVDPEQLKQAIAGFKKADPSGIHKIMVEMLLKKADLDKNGSITEEELLKARIGEDKISPDRLAKIVEKRKALFAKYAGADKALDADELMKMLGEVHASVMGQIHGNHGGILKHLFDFKAELLAKYDADKDGKLTGAELEKLKVDRAEEQIKRHQDFIKKLCEANAALKDKEICK